MSKDIATVEMEITPYIEDLLKKEPFFLEIEMLQGTREVLNDGRIKYEIKIVDHTKQDIIKEFVLKMISQSHMHPEIKNQ